MRRAVMGLVSGVCCLSACGAETPPVASTGATVVLDASGSRLWLTSPDDDRVVAVDAVTLAETMHADVTGAPQQLVAIPGALAVTLAQASELAFVATSGLSVTRVAIPCGGARGIAFDGARTLFVTCPNDDRVVALDVHSMTVTHVLTVPGRPTALAIAGDRLAITSSRTGVVQTLSRSHLDSTPTSTVATAIDPLLVETLALETAPGHAASQTDALAARDDGHAFVAAFTRVDFDSDRARPPAAGGYGSVVDGNPRIEPRLLAPCGGRYAHFDGGVRAASGPSAVALVHGVLWVVNQYTDTVLALSCEGSDEPTLAGELSTADVEPMVLGAFRTGRGPRGLAVAADGRSAYVDVAFDHAVARLALDDVHDVTAPTAPQLAVARMLGTTALSATALRGRALFHDAVDTHLTPSGIVTCATCHPSGGDDGLSWFLHTTNVGPKLRRTPAAWGARPALAPFHWDGQFADATTLAHTAIVELMSGDALLVDTDAIAAYMAATAPPPPLPLTADEATSAARGQSLFASPSVGCTTCHAGPLFSDGLTHSVIAPTTDADATLADVDTPSLIAIRARAPYFHDGRAATLRDVLDATGAHGHTSALTSAEIDDLVMYLRSL